MTLTHHAVALRLRKLLYPAASLDCGAFYILYYPCRVRKPGRGVI